MGLEYRLSKPPLRATSSFNASKCMSKPFRFPVICYDISVLVNGSCVKSVWAYSITGEASDGTYHPIGSCCTFFGHISHNQSYCECVMRHWFTCLRYTIYGTKRGQIESSIRENLMKCCCMKLEHREVSNCFFWIDLEVETLSHE